MRNPLSELMLVLALLMVHATLYPYQFSPAASPYLQWTAPVSRSDWLDAILNFYFFLPLGVLAGIRFRERQGMLGSLLGVTLLSLGVELAQAHIPGRHSSLRDVVLNSLGAAAGMIGAHLPLFDRELIDRRLRQAIAERGILLLAVLWGCWRFFPVVPAFRLATLGRLLDMGFEASWIDWRLLESALLNALLIFLVGSNYGRRAGLLCSAFVALLSPLELFVVTRQESFPLVVWAIAGALAAAALLAADVLPPIRVLAGLSLALLAYRELEPFAWQQIRFRDFSWLPFQSTFELTRDAALRILALKCFLYWYTLRQLCLGWNWQPLPVGLAMAGVMLLAEWGQQYQQTRTPELTDPFLCLLGTLPALRLVRAYNEPPDNR
jgi:VanZ family protein